MSKIGVGLKIDVTNIDKARLHKGEKGTYLDATVFIDLDNFDKYGQSGMITQDVTKEERAKKINGPILGNAKIFYTDGIAMPLSGEPEVPAQSDVPSSTPNDMPDEDIPF